MNGVADLAAHYALTTGAAVMVSAAVLRCRRLAPWGAALSGTGTCMLAVLGATGRNWLWTWACAAIVAGHLGILANAAGKRGS